MTTEASCSENILEPAFRSAIDSFSDLMDQNGKVFLVGAGCSKCAGLPLMDELTKIVLESESISSSSSGIINGIMKNFDGTSVQNIEDYLSELVDLLAISERRESRNANNLNVEIAGKQYTACQLRGAVNEIKNQIAQTIESNGKAINISIHQNFVKSVHRPTRPGKINGIGTVDYICLNYDTLLEDAMALEKITYADGIDGGQTGWWNPLVFERKDLMSRIFKLHGSINWCELDTDPLPRRIAGNLNISEKGEKKLLIWPASTKYRETQRDPYAQLIDYARRSLTSERGSQKILIICGYSFSDSHINIEVDRAVRESEGRLTVVVFTSDDEPIGQLKMWHQDGSISDQFLIYANKGFFHGATVSRSDTPLPWWRFEVLTRLLGGER